MTAEPRKISFRLIVALLLLIVIPPLLPLLISRQWDWWEAWLYFVLYVLAFAVSRLLASRRHPDIIAERARTFQHQDAAWWDRFLVPLIGIGGILTMVVAGLDALYGWSAPVSWLVKGASLAMIIAGDVLASYALIENRYFSGTVRLQTDRGQVVVSGGPYRWLRHPGYAGGILSYLGTPLFLNSFWALLPACFIALLMVVRTALEDHYLLEGLPGYGEYAGRVRYRLLRGVW